MMEIQSNDGNPVETHHPVKRNIILIPKSIPILFFKLCSYIHVSIRNNCPSIPWPYRKRLCGYIHFLHYQSIWATSRLADDSFGWTWVATVFPNRRIANDIHSFPYYYVVFVVYTIGIAAYVFLEFLLCNVLSN